MPTNRGVVVTGEEWALAASVFFSGLAAGFLGALCTIIRPMQAAMDGRTFRNFMEEFLRYADHGLGQVYNLAWAFVPVPGAVVALVLLWDDPGSTSFILTAIGLGVMLVGIWLNGRYTTCAGGSVSRNVLPVIVTPTTSTSVSINWPFLSYLLRRMRFPIGFVPRYSFANASFTTATGDVSARSADRKPRPARMGTPNVSK